MASTKTMRAIDRLRKAANLQATRKEVTLSDGTVFEMWVTPLTLAEKERAQRNRVGRRLKKAGGGLLKQAGDRSGAMLESMNPDSQGLPGLLKRVKKG